jgi:hypothetical protein
MNRFELNSAKEVLKQRKKSTEKLIQDYYNEKDSGNKKRLLACIKRIDPTFKPK